MRIRILEDRGYSDRAISIYKGVGEVVYGDSKDTDELTDVLVVRLGALVGRRMMQKYPSLRYVVSPTTGVTHLELEQLDKSGVEVITLRDCYDEIGSISSTAEFSLMLILMINRGVSRFYSDLYGSGIKGRMSYRGAEMSEKTLGIVGNGRIGRLLRSYTESLFGSVKSWDIDNKRMEEIEPSSRSGSLQDLCKEADTVCFCVDLNETSKKMIDSGLIGLMRSDVCIVNTSRGEIADESAILGALKDGRIGGYATDVIDKELSTDSNKSELIELSKGGYNLIVTPHIGGCTKQAMEKTEIIISREFIRRITREAISRD